MAKNRSIEQKILKMKRRGRYARLSGGVSVSQDKVGPTPFTEDVYGNTTTLKTKMVLVGHISLSRQVINTGRGPDASRMQEYYARISSESKSTTLMEDLGIKDSRYAHVWLNTPKTNRITLVNNELGRLDMYWHEERWFLVDLDYRKKLIKRSRDYGSKRAIEERLNSNRIQWVEQIPMVIGV